MKIHSLQSLISGLINSTPRQPIDQIDDDDAKAVGTTVRFDPRTRRFIETHAEQMGVSIQDFIKLTLRAVMTATIEPQATQLELMVDRFFEVFTAHGIALTDIPRMLPERERRITRSDLLSRKDLIDKLDDDVIKFVAKLFNVQVSFLTGVDNNPYKTPHQSIYTNVGATAFRLAILNNRYGRVKVYFVAERGPIFDRLAQANRGENTVDDVEIGVIIETERSVDDVYFTTYEIWERLRWNYKPSRLDLKALMLFCEKTSIRYDGILLERDISNQLFSGKILVPGVMKKPRNLWHPDMLVWNDKERNPELLELPSVRRHYQESGAQHYEDAVRNPRTIVDWEHFEKTGEDAQMAGSSGQ